MYLKYLIYLHTPTIIIFLTNNNVFTKINSCIEIVGTIITYYRAWLNISLSK